nr:MAG TPA: shock protein B [Caudoviricetes sp.]
MDNLTTDFLSFFVPYLIVVLGVAVPLATKMAKDVILHYRDRYREKEGMLMDELRKEISARRDAEREAELLRKTKAAEIERLTKKVATLEGQLSALRANSSKHNEL